MPPSAPATPAWVKTMLLELKPDLAGREQVCALFAAQADVPPWVKRVEKEIENGLIPGLQIEELETISPAHLGALLGQQCANLASVAEWLNNLQTGQAASGAKMERAMARASTKLVGGFQKTTRHALALALQQPHHEAAPFFQAFAAAFARQPGNHGSNLGTTAFPVYLWLLILHPLMPQCQSVAQLHQVLEKILGVKCRSAVIKSAVFVPNSGHKGG